MRRNGEWQCGTLHLYHLHDCGTIHHKWCSSKNAHSTSHRNKFSSYIPAGASFMVNLPSALFFSDTQWNTVLLCSIENVSIKPSMAVEMVPFSKSYSVRSKLAAFHEPVWRVKIVKF